MASETNEDTFKKFKENYIYKSFKSLEHLYKNQLFCDLTLVSKDAVEFKVHKNVVYSASGYFEGLYQSDMKESVADRINMDFVSGQILELIISFIYEAELKTDVVEEIQEVAEKSDYLQIDQLRDMCLVLLQKNIDESNCLKLWRLANRLSADKFGDTCITHIFQFAEKLFDNASFLNDLSVDELKQLLTDRRLPFSEESVFQYALRWARNDIEMFNEVIDCIRFPLLSKQFILSDIFTNTILIQNRKVLEKVVECARYQWREDVLLDCTSQQVGPRQKAFLAVIDLNVVRISSSGEILDSQNDKQFSKRSFGYTTFHHKLLFICGGINSIIGKYTNTCEYYSPKSGKFKSFPSLETARSWHQCSLIDDNIYVCGGKYSEKSVEIFDLGKEQWTKGPSMISPRIAFGLTSMTRSLYAMGGLVSKRVEFLDPRSSNSWNIINDEFTTYKYTQCVSIGTEIYCFRKNDHVCIFDTRMNKLRKVDCGYNKFVENANNFKVCELDGDIGMVLVNKGVVRFFKYNTTGELIYKKELTKPLSHYSFCLSTYYN